MSNLQEPEFPAMVFFIRDNRRTSDTECPECQYVYPNEKIKKHMCDILDYIKCKGCEHHYPNEAIGKCRGKQSWTQLFQSASQP